MGNHEDLFLDWARGGSKYPQYCWLDNGGTATLAQLSKMMDGSLQIPAFLIDYLSELPLRINVSQLDWPRDLIITHAPLLGGYMDADAQELGQFWNRGWVDQVTEIPGTLQLFGHNSYWGWQTWKNDAGDVYAANLDGSRDDLLVGMAWPGGGIIVESYRG